MDDNKKQNDFTVPDSSSDESEAKEPKQNSENELKLDSEILTKENKESIISEAAKKAKEHVNENKKQTVSQAVLDLAQLNNTEEKNTPHHNLNLDASPGFGLKAAWAVTGAIVLAGFLTWVLANFILFKLPYTLEAIAGLAVAALWIGAGYKRFSNPTLIGGLAIIWSLAALLNALHGLPTIISSGGGELKSWKHALIMLIPVGIFTLANLTTIWLTTITIKKKLIRNIIFVCALFGLIPLIYAYYSLFNPNIGLNSLTWISEPFSFFKILPWFLSPALFTLILIPALGIFLCIKRQFQVFKLEKTYRHFIPLLLSLALILNVVLGIIYLEKAYNVNVVNLDSQLSEYYPLAKNSEIEKKLKEGEQVIIIDPNLIKEEIFPEGFLDDTEVEIKEKINQKTTEIPATSLLPKVPSLIDDKNIQNEDSQVPSLTDDENIQNEEATISQVPSLTDDENIQNEEVTISQVPSLIDDKNTQNEELTISQVFNLLDDKNMQNEKSPAKEESIIIKSDDLQVKKTVTDEEIAVFKQELNELTKQLRYLNNKALESEQEIKKLKQKLTQSEENFMALENQYLILQDNFLSLKGGNLPFGEQRTLPPTEPPTNSDDSYDYLLSFPLNKKSITKGIAV